MADPLLNVDFETFMGGTILAMNVALVYVQLTSEACTLSPPILTLITHVIVCMAYQLHKLISMRRTALRIRFL